MGHEAGDEESAARGEGGGVISPDGPDEREFDANESYDRDIDDADVAELLAGEARHFIDWPTPILVYPVELTAPEYTDEKLIALARQRLAMETS